ncbi:MAG: lipoprotein insertase outer membrane protein LolB [Sterolibacterium sp.]|nr:lipoprotein insertase outer membrane protein LolB [Sterolibacterium sp.]
MTRLVLPALALMLMLPGCALLPDTARQVKLESRRARATIDVFTLSGRIAAHQGQRRYSASMTWRHAPESDEILLATPLGQGIAELTRDAAGTRLITAERREFTAPDWQALSTQMFGFSLPLSLLPRWLVADVPADALGVSYDGVGRMRHMVAADWWVDYLDYESEAADALPTLIELKREDIEVRLKIDEWQLIPIPNQP